MLRYFISVAFLALLPCSAAPDGARPADSAKAYSKTHTLQGISFTVTCPNNSSINKLTITPKGLVGDNKPITVEADGSITGSEVADLNGDGSPEIYVYVNSAGSGSYTTLIAYGANNKKSLSQIYLPELSDDKTNSKGYLGHDEFRVVENSLVRRFPTYKDGDSNAKPTGVTRQLQYKLKAGEAGWVLRLDKTTEY